MKKNFFLISTFYLWFFLISKSGTIVAQGWKDHPMDSKMTEIWEPEVPVVIPGNVPEDPPSDAIILFNGENLGLEWTNGDGTGQPDWLVGEGCVTVVKGKGSIKTKRNFNDFQLHIEWRTPAEVVGEGQRRGNSGVYLQGIYEVQIMDSYKNKTYINGQAASIYKQYAPLANACKGPGQWQVYEIIYTAPRFRDNGTYFTPPYVTIIHNGVLVQNHVAVRGPGVVAGIPEYFVTSHGAGPILLQDHGTPVSFRNIWIRDL